MTATDWDKHTLCSAGPAPEMSLCQVPQNQPLVFNPQDKLQAINLIGKGHAQITFVPLALMLHLEDNCCTCSMSPKQAAFIKTVACMHGTI